jgi:hypothetical protein
VAMDDLNINDVTIDSDFESELQQVAPIYLMEERSPNAIVTIISEAFNLYIWLCKACVSIQEKIMTEKF